MTRFPLPGVFPGGVGVSQAERQAVVWIYRGIPAAAPAALVGLATFTVERDRDIVVERSRTFAAERARDFTVERSPDNG